MSGLACKISGHLSMLGPKTPETDPEKAIDLMGDYNMFGHFIFHCE